MMPATGARIWHRSTSAFQRRVSVASSSRGAHWRRASSTLAAVTTQSISNSDSSSSTSSSWFLPEAALAAAGYSIFLGHDRNRLQTTTDCCGIVGVVGPPELDANEFLLNGLTILKNRGFDGAGLATMSSHGGPMSITKYASRGDSSPEDSSIELVRAEASKKKLEHISHSVGMAHTRWATHGAKTDANAHPHTDSSGKIAIVHNGTLNNSRELRRELKNAGHVFDGESDSEVLAKLIGHYYAELEKEEKKQSELLSSLDMKSTKSASSMVKKATEKALQRCEGTWGLCVMCSDAPSELVVACHGSPLVLGTTDDRTFVASEPAAFSRFTKTFIPMREGEIAVLHADGQTLDLARKETVADEWEEEKGPEPYPHWTLKECMEQPEAIAQALGFGGRLGSHRVFLGGLDKEFDRLSKVKHIIFSGCGTSLNAAKYGERLMRHLGSVDSVYSIDSAEFDEIDYPSRQGLDEAALIAVSQSGETTDVVNLVTEAMTNGINVLSVVNEVGSTLARTTKLGAYCYAGKEHGVASTKSFAAQVTVLSLIALWFQQLRPGAYHSIEANRLKEALMRLPLSFGVALKTREQCRAIAEKLNGREHCFVLGKGFAEPVALEGSLKLKELAYFHAEGYSGGALKHGPFALIDGATGQFGPTPVIMIILDDQHAHHMRTAAEEVKARGAEVIIITDNPKLADSLDENPIIIPTNGPLTALGAVVPLQLLAYELAVLRGNNPDTPRHLAKTLLV